MFPSPGEACLAGLGSLKCSISQAGPTLTGPSNLQSPWRGDLSLRESQGSADFPVPYPICSAKLKPDFLNGSPGHPALSPLHPAGHPAGCSLGQGGCQGQPGSSQAATARRRCLLTQSHLWEQLRGFSGWGGCQAPCPLWGQGCDEAGSLHPGWLRKVAKACTHAQRSSSSQQQGRSERGEGNGLLWMGKGSLRN